MFVVTSSWCLSLVVSGFTELPWRCQGCGGQVSSTNVVMLPCESRVEVEKFVGAIYGRDLDLSLDEPFHGFTDREQDTARKLNPFCKYLNPSILNVVNLFPN